MGFLDRLPTPPPWLLALFRVLQFLSGVISLILYGVYVAGLVNGTESPQQAVLGIAGAAVVWALTAFLQHLWAHRGNMKSGEAKKGMIRKGGVIAAALIIFIVVDLCFVVLSAVAAGITGSERGRCGRVVGGGGGGDDDGEEDGANRSVPTGRCSSLNGAFALSIINMYVDLICSIHSAIRTCCHIGREYLGDTCNLARAYVQA